MGGLAGRAARRRGSAGPGQRSAELSTVVSYSWCWLCLWHLISVRLAANQVAKAVEVARQLLVPPQQRLPDELEAAIQAAIDAWEQGGARACHGRIGLGGRCGPAVEVRLSTAPPTANTCPKRQMNKYVRPRWVGGESSIWLVSLSARIGNSGRHPAIMGDSTISAYSAGSVSN